MPERTYLENFKHLKPNQKSALVAGFIPIIVSVVAACFDKEKALPLYLLALSITSSTFVDRFSKLVFEEDVRTKLEDISSQKNGLAYLGTQQKAVVWFTKNYKGAIKAYNTVFNRKTGVGFMTTEQKDYIAAIRNAIHEGCEWTDVYFPNQSDTVFDPNDFKDAKGSYEKHVLTTELPLFQCLVVHFDDESKAVLFGYGFKSIIGDVESKVYFSDNSETVSYFEKYLVSLVEAAKKQQPHRPGALPQQGPEEFKLS